MAARTSLPHSRRTWLQSTTGLLAALPASALLADERPPVKEPRATSGDNRFEPNWDERLTITVGPQDADLVGTSEKVIQAAVDSITRWGGGTVKILPGTYKLRNAVYLSSKVRILGSGADSVLLKEPSLTTKVTADSDWFDQELTLDSDLGFQVGDGICIRAKNPHHTGSTVLKRTLVAKSGKRFKLDRPLRENVWRMGTPTVSTLFPIFSGDNVHDIVIENITLDGNKANNENLDGNYAGCVFLQDCNRVVMRKIDAVNYNGDGLSWQICHDCVVEDCHSHGHTGLGLHPGSGSQRPVMVRNRLEGNSIGIFFCWGVKFGLAEENTIVGNSTVGVSIGHRDTDNIVRKNVIRDSGISGVLFRPERGEGFSGDRNLITGNTITNSGPANGVAIDVQGYTNAIQLIGNELRETRAPEQRIALRFGEHAGKIESHENSLNGFAQELVDQRVKG